MRILRVGSRGSELALTQTRRVIAGLQKKEPALRVEIEIIRTKGDIIKDVPLTRVGDRGLFIKEIETALLEKRIDFAVHSMKDVPSQIPDGLILAVTTERLDPSDVLITRKVRCLGDLPQNATLATGSLRRRSQALAHRPDLQIVELRGNVTTRIAKFEKSSWDAVILAGAGLERLSISPPVAAKIPTEQMLPAVGQGALALETRSDDQDVIGRLLGLEHPPTAVAVRAERAFLRRLEGGCQVPIAALGTIRDNNHLALEGYIGTIDGTRFIRKRSEAPTSDAERLGTTLAEEILGEGGAEILEETRRLQQSP
jgi:hydroxymethylbilane synthase